MRTFSVAGGCLILMASFTLLGCGGGDSSDSSAGRSAPTPGPAASTLTIPGPMQAFSDDGDVAEIVISADDMIRYDTERFAVRPGQMVRVTLNHTGSLPAQAMGHNFVLLYSGDDPLEFGADVGERFGSFSNDFVPDVLRDRVIALTRMIGGGESVTVEFQAPQDPGEYPYLCSFPGHFAQMNGIMAVE